MQTHNYKATVSSERHRTTTRCATMRRTIQVRSRSKTDLVELVASLQRSLPRLSTQQSIRREENAARVLLIHNALQ